MSDGTFNPRSILARTPCNTIDHLGAKPLKNQQDAKPALTYEPGGRTFESCRAHQLPSGGRTNLRSLESPASNGWQGRFPPLVGGSGPEGPSIRNLHPDEAATRAAVLERVHGQRDLVTGLQRRGLPSVAKHHSGCPRLDAPFGLPALAVGDKDLQPHMRIGELNFFDNRFHRHVLAEIEHRKGMMGVCHGARQKQRCSSTRTGYTFHRTPFKRPV